MSCRKHLQIRFCFVIHCKQLSEICAHYVTHLELAGAWRAYALKDLSSLAEATFDFNVYHFPWGGKRSDQVTNLSTMDNIFKSMSSSVKSFFLLGSRWWFIIVIIFPPLMTCAAIYTCYHLPKLILHLIDDSAGSLHVWKTRDDSVPGETETCHCKNRGRLLRHTMHSFLIADLFWNWSPD